MTGSANPKRDEEHREVRATASSLTLLIFIVELNKFVTVSMGFGPGFALGILLDVVFE
jgi:hypothetical protein